MDFNKLYGIKSYQETKVITIDELFECEEDDTEFNKILHNLTEIQLPKKTNKVTNTNNKLNVNKETYYMEQINNYYNKLDDNNILKIIDIINRKSNISLRLIEWFITKYSLQITDFYMNDTIPVNIYNSYHIKTKLYQKKYFDPFRRYNIFEYKFKDRDDLKINTTISQLNFFKWLFENNIYEYIEKNYYNLSKIMSNYNTNEEDNKCRKRLKK